MGFDEALDLAGRAAAGLTRLGTRRGDRVAFVLRDGPEVLLSLLAVSELGACAVFLDPGLSPGRRKDALRVLGPKLIIEADAAARLLRGRRPKASASKDRGRPGDPAVVFRGIPVCARSQWVVHTQGSLLAGAAALAERFASLGRGSEWCLWPAGSYFGLLDAVCALQRGGRVVLGGWSPAAAEQLQAACLDLPLPVLSSFSGGGARARRPPEGLRWVRCSGGPVPERAAQGLERSSGIPVVALFGGPLWGPVASTQPSLGARKSGCVGLPLHGCDLAVFDRSGRRSRPGQPGEIAVRSAGQGTLLFDGRASSAHAWRRTGVRGALDRDGELHLLRRSG
jgi:long-chain acyl-CoA synthetase